MEHSRQLLEATMRGGTVDARLKELLAVRVSQVNHCHY
jgi:alkylhydroperoxidase family enzyme